MNFLRKILFFLTVMSLASSAYAAGDYILENKFKKELPKAEQGDVKAQYAVGEMYEKGKGAVRDVNKAFDWYMKAANQNDKKAAYKVGLFYYQGRGVEVNYEQAYSWFSKSASQDYVRAQYYLGEMYEKGLGVGKNTNTAMEWYEKALKGGYRTAAEGIERIKTSKKEKPRFLERPRVKPDAGQATKDSVLLGGWTKRDKPAEYLPSEMTECISKGKNIECLSKDITRSIGMADITYTTKAIIFSFTGDNFFKISYRNNVSKITVTNKDFAESGREVPVKLGWQDAEHQLSCELENNNSIECTKNRLRKIKLKR